MTNYTKEQREEIYAKAIDKWGVEAQFGMILEESLELALATRKFLRDHGSQERYNHLIGEFADVEIMTEQFKMMYKNKNVEEDIQRIKDQKISRLEKRVKSNKFNG